jgi:hypothetical protein
MDIEKTDSFGIISLASMATIVFKANGIRVWSLGQSDITESVSLAYSLNSFATFLGNTASVDDVQKASQSISLVLTIVTTSRACIVARGWSRK